MFFGISKDNYEDGAKFWSFVVLDLKQIRSQILIMQYFRNIADHDELH